MCLITCADSAGAKWFPGSFAAPLGEFLLPYATKLSASKWMDNVCKLLGTLLTHVFDRNVIQVHKRRIGHLAAVHLDEVLAPLLSLRCSLRSKQAFFLNIVRNIFVTSLPLRHMRKVVSCCVLASSPRSVSGPMSKAAHWFTNRTTTHLKGETLIVGYWRTMFHRVQDASAMLSPPNCALFSIVGRVP